MTSNEDVDALLNRVLVVSSLDEMDLSRRRPRSMSKLGIYGAVARASGRFLGSNER